MSRIINPWRIASRPRHAAVFLTAAFTLFGNTSQVLADSFVITNGQTETATQLLDGDNETGVVEAGGSINTAAFAAFGINSTGADATISNSGNISTTGPFARGISSTGASAITSNSGSISTTGGSAYGIQSFGIDASISNSGSISTAGGTAFGIYSLGSDAMISNSGSISTTGGSAFGIWSTGTDASISNSGNISTTGNDADGINSSGTDAIISNSGSVSTTGDNAHGINSSGANATISNSGNISTAGAGAFGIFSTSTDATISNSGNISTAGAGAFGILSTNTDATISNSGNISTAGAGAFGIFSAGDNASISNSGSVSTTGATAHGISFVGANATIHNSGLLSATGTGAFAVLGGNDTQTLNLLSGSRILGAIDMGAGEDAANIYGGYGSASLTFANTEHINLFIDNAVTVGNTVVVVDPTSESVSGSALNALTSGAHNVVSQRMQHTPAVEPVQVAALELGPGMWYQDRGPVVWGQLFGYNGERGAEDQVQAYDHDYHGFMTGYERDSSGSRVGLLAGAARGKTDSDSQNRESDSLFVGVYGHLNLGQVNLTASLLAGRENHDNERAVLDNLQGLEIAQSDTDSYFISPSLTLSAAYSIRPDIELRPSATLTYSAARYESYDESGTTNANLDIGSRKLQALSTRLQLEAAKQFKGGELSLRLGALSRHIDADDVRVSLAGSDFRYNAASDDNVTGGFIGLGAYVSLNKNLELVADIEMGGMSGDEDYLSGHVTLQYKF